MLTELHLASVHASDAGGPGGIGVVGVLATLLAVALIIASGLLWFHRSRRRAQPDPPARSRANGSDERPAG